MMNYRLLGRLISSLIVVGTLLAMTFTGCTEVDDSLGSEFVPGNQQLKVGYRRLDPCLRTALYRTDSIKTSNLYVGMLGSTHSDTFGLRTAGFYTQYTWGYCPDSVDGFGYRPIFDSIIMGLVVTNYGGDTTVTRRYEVYEVLADDFLEEQKDTVFYGTFDIDPYLDSEPLFTFDFPNQEKGVYVMSNAVKLEPTAKGMDLIERMMLMRGAYPDNDMKGFYDPKDWVKNFKGIYVKPMEDAQSREQSSIYEIDLTQSGLVLYGRNRNTEDPKLIQDTTVSLYYFYDSSVEAGRASINTLRHDYSSSLLADYEFEEDAKERSLTDLCYVEGLAGVVTTITFTESLFEQIEQILDQERDDWGVPYNSLAINRAELAIYDVEADYDWQAITPTEEFIWRMDNSLQRLGLYTSYKNLVGIADYAYAIEESTSLNYGGYINRSQGCYVMDISAYIQALWNSYLKDKEAMLSNEEKRTIYLAPEAYSVNDFATMTGQGMEADTNNAPIKLELTYTLIK